MKAKLVLRMFFSVWMLSVSTYAGELNDYNPYDYNIPDNCTNMNSDLLLSGAPADAEITKVKTYFEINHLRWSDLTIWLTAYYNGSWHDRILYSQGSLSGSGTLARTIDNMYTWNGASPNQTWYLGVRDCVAGQTGYIAFFELWVTYEANAPPNTPYNPDPYDGESNVPSTADLDWSCSDPDGDAIYYTVYFEKNDASPDNIVKNDATGSSVSLSTLDYDSHYYWQVRADDHNGGVTLGPVWDFYTETAPVVDAEIVVLPIPDAVAGETISIDYQVTNTGNVSASFGVGAEIWLNGDRLVDLGHQYTPIISPGNTYNGSYSFPIPSHWETDTYVARAAVWTGAPGSSTWLDSYDRDFFVEAQQISGIITVEPISTITAGEQVTVRYTVTNTGNSTRTFGVGCEIRQGPVVMDDLGTQTTAHIAPSGGYSGSFTYTIPSGWPSGTYTARAVLWSETPGSSTWLDSFDEDFSLIGTAASITSFVPPTGAVTRGQEVHATVTIQNTGGITRDFWVGLSFWGPMSEEWPNGWMDVNPIQTPELSPSAIHTATFSFEIPGWLPQGQFGAITAVWPGYDPVNHLMIDPRLAEAEVQVTFELTGPPDESSLYGEIVFPPDRVYDLTNSYEYVHQFSRDYLTNPGPFNGAIVRVSKMSPEAGGDSRLSILLSANSLDNRVETIHGKSHSQLLVVVPDDVTLSGIETRIDGDLRTWQDYGDLGIRTVFLFLPVGEVLGINELAAHAVGSLAEEAIAAGFYRATSPLNSDVPTAINDLDGNKLLAIDFDLDKWSQDIVSFDEFELQFDISFDGQAKPITIIPDVRYETWDYRSLGTIRFSLSNAFLFMTWGSSVESIPWPNEEFRKEIDIFPAALGLDEPIELGGRIAFHSYSGYLAPPLDEIDGNVFIYSVTDDTRRNLTEGLGLDNAMNPHISDDGARIVFMAIPAGASRTRANLELYSYDLSRNGLSRLTTNSVPDEDPKFSPDGKHILFKRNGEIYRMSFDGTGIQQFTTSGTEKSGPNYSPDGSQIVFWYGSKSSADIGIMDAALPSSDELLYGTANFQEMYPIFWNSDSILFSRWEYADTDPDPPNPPDDIWVYLISGASASKIATSAVNRAGIDDADAFPVNSEYIGLSSTRNSGSGYDIFLANPTVNAEASTGLLQTSHDDLGGWYSPFNHSRSVTVTSPGNGSEYTPSQEIIVAISAWSDGAVWIGADPSVTLDGPSMFEYNGFVDNGSNGDAVAGDGIYSATITLPSEAGDYTLTARATSLDNGISNQIESLAQPSISIREATGSLLVNIEPAGGIAAGAQWRVDGGAWHNSGYTQTGLTVGQHEVSFSAITDWTTPSPQTVTINNNLLTTATGTYVQHTGALTVTILPQEAIDAGAKWRRAGTSTWHNSGYTESEIPVGEYDVEFLDISSWTPPTNVPVTISYNQTSTVEGTYTQETGSVLVTIEPQGARDAGAQWRLDGGLWLNSGATSGEISIGEHTVDFKPIDCWVTPDSQQMMVIIGDTSIGSGTYVSMGKPDKPDVECVAGCGYVDIQIYAFNSKSYPVNISLFSEESWLSTWSLPPGGTLNATFRFNTSAAADYCFTSYATSMCGDSEPDVCCAIPLVPPSPPQPSFLFFECYSITFGWSEVEGAEGYCVYINGDSVWCGNETIHQFIDLEPVEYVFTVASYNECGPGPQSHGAGGIPPSIPEVPNWCLASNDSCGFIVLNWENVNGDSGYLVYRDGNALPLGATTHDDTNFVDSVTGEHEYSVSALNQCGESERSETTIGTGKTSPVGTQPRINPLVNEFRVEWLSDTLASSYGLKIMPPASSDGSTFVISDTSYLYVLPTESNGLPQSGRYIVELSSLNDCGTSRAMADTLESYHIGGLVMDPENNVPLSDSEVYIGTPSANLIFPNEYVLFDTAVTNSDGFYRFVVPPGTYEVWRELVVGNIYTVTLSDSSVEGYNFDIATDIADIESPDLPITFALNQNFPNPFNPVTVIEFSVPTRCWVTIEIFNVLGEKVTTLIEEYKSAGHYRIEWNGADEIGKSLTSGVYLYRFQAGDYVETKKMMLLK